MAKTVWTHELMKREGTGERIERKAGSRRNGKNENVNDTTLLLTDRMKGMAGCGKTHLLVLHG